MAVKFLIEKTTFWADVYATPGYWNRPPSVFKPVTRYLADDDAWTRHAAKAIQFKNAIKASHYLPKNRAGKTPPYIKVIEWQG